MHTFLGMPLTAISLWYYVNYYYYYYYYYYKHSHDVGQRGPGESR